MDHTHLNELCPPDCSALSTPRPSGRGGGGLALIHRDHFPSTKLNSNSFTSFELHIVKVGFNPSFYCIIIYRPPGPARVFLDEFEEFLSGILKLDKVLLLGDFNAHFEDSSCVFSSELSFLMESFNFIQHVTGPTHVKGHTLDLVFSLGLEIHQLCLEDSLVSDHSWIYFNVTFPLLPSPAPLVSQRRILDQNVSDGFTDLFDINSFKSFYDVDSFMNSFNSHCETILNEVAPVRVKIAYPKLSHPWMNEEIRSSRRLCRKVERLWKSTNLEVHRLHLKDLICSLNEMIKQARSAFFCKLISSNKKTPKFVFSTLSSLVSPSASKFPNLSLPDCSSFLQGFLAKVLDVGANIPPLASVQLSQSPHCSHLWSSFAPVSVEDIHSLLERIKPSSCPLDIIPTSVFLKVFQCIGSTVVDLINLSLKLGSVPNFLKHALINPVLKKPNLDQSDQNNL
ncbi:uncharacterized protein LOC112143035 [Oryzias melastigma]|uniref:uncharacterized protein LOC112143035 n=1 Tax=Oryzias melastigma TaxID=30732 RepID=UPI00168D5407|nr:uncharacterized protein LOC112143035 [Oryzias melastigma]